MRRVLCLAAFLLAGPAPAQDKPKPNTLTPKEVADGWVLLFDGETTFGWKIDGAAEVKDGMLILGKDGKPGSAYSTARFGKYAEVKLDVDGNVQLRKLGRVPAEERSKPGEWYTYGLVAAKGMDTITRSAGRGGYFMNFFSTPAEAEGAPVFVQSFGKGVGRVRSVKIRPLEATPLFNGKDLTGWKVFPGEKYKSKFAVTPAGEIGVKDGPGDLQTDKTFDNFVLQLECKTNGKALNSGVFFRCLEGQYQQGYEAQIQNAFVGDDRTKPADFGTGAIYRRIAARKVVSNDNEWFTLTLAADGKHISTWVNGYQTVDWTDDRPAEENARKGYRAGKGHLSIQGHDPTTDILFRNIRVAEIK